MAFPDGLIRAARRHPRNASKAAPFRGGLVSRDRNLIAAWEKDPRSVVAGCVSRQK